MKRPNGRAKRSPANAPYKSSRFLFEFEKLMLLTKVNLIAPRLSARISPFRTEFSVVVWRSVRNQTSPRRLRFAHGVLRFQWKFTADWSEKFDEKLCCNIMSHSLTAGSRDRNVFFGFATAPGLICGSGVVRKACSHSLPWPRETEIMPSCSRTLRCYEISELKRDTEAFRSKKYGVKLLDE